MTTIKVEVQPLTEATLLNYHQVKTLPEAAECNWSAEDEEGWDF